MKSSSRRKKLDVFDLREEDELLEAADAKNLEKFKPAADRCEQVSKYEILECVESNLDLPTKHAFVVEAPSVDISTIHGGHSEDNGIDGSCLDGKSNGAEPVESSQEIALQFDLNGQGSQTFFPVDDQEPRHTSFEQDASSLGTFSDGKIHSSCSPPGPQSNGRAAEFYPDSDVSFDDQTSSKNASDSEENVSLDDYASKHSVDPMRMEDKDGATVICAEYLTFKNRCYVQPLLVFSSSSVIVEWSAAYEKGESFLQMWELDDIIRVSCQWLQKIAAVSIKLRVVAKAPSCGDDTHNSSGIEELNFEVVDSNWSSRREVILGSNARYAAIWEDTSMDLLKNELEALLMVDVVNCLFANICKASIMEEEDDQVDFNNEKPYFPNIDWPFEEIVYPKGDVDAVSISKRDIDLLQPETFVNDTIIDFYIKYLKNTLQPEDSIRFHFFNSFFFRKLADLDKDPSSVSDGRAAFLRVRKWTRKINLFEKDYIFIPVNFNLHWSLIVICHLGEMKCFSDEDLLHSSKVPCVLHMDSIKGNHSGLKNLVQSYLWEEWQERGMDASAELSSKFSELRFVPLELPQQENAYDCGLFLLHYLELFLMDAPKAFNPLKISKFSGFLSMNWFLPFEASLKRRAIQMLIYELLDDRSPEADSCEDNQSSGTQEVECQNICNADSSPEECSLLAGNSVVEGGRGTDVNLLAEFSMSSRCLSQSGMVLREVFNSEDVGPLLDRTHSFEQQGYYNFDCTLSSIEPEETEIGMEYPSYMPTGNSGESEDKDIRGVSAQVAATSNGLDTTSWQTGLCMLVENGKAESPEGTPRAVDEDLNPVRTIEIDHADQGRSPDRDLEADRPGSLTPESLLSICPLQQSNDAMDISGVESNGLDSEIMLGTNQHENPDPSPSRNDTLLELHLDYGTTQTRQLLDGRVDQEVPSENPDDGVICDTASLKLDIGLSADLGLAAPDALTPMKEETGSVHEEEPNAKRLRVNPPTENMSEDLHL